MFKTMRKLRFQKNLATSVGRAADDVTDTMFMDLRRRAERLDEAAGAEILGLLGERVWGAGLHAEFHRAVRAAALKALSTPWASAIVNALVAKDVRAATEIWNEVIAEIRDGLMPAEPALGDLPPGLGLRALSVGLQSLDGGLGRTAQRDTQPIYEWCTKNLAAGVEAYLSSTTDGSPESDESSRDSSLRGELEGAATRIGAEFSKLDSKEQRRRLDLVRSRGGGPLGREVADLVDKVFLGLQAGTLDETDALTVLRTIQGACGGGFPVRLGITALLHGYWNGVVEIHGGSGPTLALPQPDLGTQSVPQLDFN